MTKITPLQLTDRDVLRALIDGADHLGTNRNGESWLLVRTTAELIDHLATLDAETADDEETWDRELDKSELDDDQCVDQPRFETMPLPLSQKARRTLDAQVRKVRTLRKRYA